MDSIAYKGLSRTSLNNVMVLLRMELTEYTNCDDGSEEIAVCALLLHNDLSRSAEEIEHALQRRLPRSEDVKDIKCAMDDDLLGEVFLPDDLRDTKQWAEGEEKKRTIKRASQKNLQARVAEVFIKARPKIAAHAKSNKGKPKSKSTGYAKPAKWTAPVEWATEDHAALMRIAPVDCRITPYQDKGYWCIEYRGCDPQFRSWTTRGDSSDYSHMYQPQIVCLGGIDGVWGRESTCVGRFLSPNFCTRRRLCVCGG
jgi:hypothetical protein